MTVLHRIASIANYVCDTFTVCRREHVNEHFPPRPGSARNFPPATKCLEQSPELKVLFAVLMAQNL